MKAILIDPFTQTVKRVEFEGDYTAIYEWIRAPCFSVVKLHREAALYVDDEGLFRGKDQRYFEVLDSGEKIGGRGLVLGVDKEGGDKDVPEDIAEVLVRPGVVTWPDVEFVDMGPTMVSKVYHPIFGEMDQIKTSPVFRKRGE